MRPAWKCMCFILWLRLLSDAKKTTNPPHIIYILADDMGWNDVSFHGSNQIPTPNIDSLAYNGVILNRHYVQPVCSPTRASLMTGKYPIHTGIHFPLYSSEKNGLPLSMKTMPQYFKEIGYNTHLVGKWHLGFFQKEYTPLSRGFDSHCGYWTGAISYYDHIYEDLVCEDPIIDNYSGHDMRRNYTSAWDVVGQYATDLFTNEAVDVINKHSSEKALFLLLSHLAVHAGNQGKWLEAPQEEINRFSYISNPNRRTYAAMVSKIDKSVGEVVTALGRNNMLGNSIIVFASDNGAPNNGLYRNWGSNYPFRGQKATLWEGGIRVPTVIWSPLIRKPSRVSYGLMHITDWLPTLLTAAGYDANSLQDLDGIDQWPAISYDYPSPRETLLVDITEIGGMSGLIIDSFKYIKGGKRFLHPKENSGFLNFDAIFSKNGPDYTTEQTTRSTCWELLQNITKDENLQSKIHDLRYEATVTCDNGDKSIINCDDSPCLFNITADPCEKKNIAAHFPLLTHHMEAALNDFKISMIPEKPYSYDPLSNPDFYNGTWSTWITNI